MYSVIIIAKNDTFHWFIFLFCISSFTGIHWYGNIWLVRYCIISTLYSLVGEISVYKTSMRKVMCACVSQLASTIFVEENLGNPSKVKHWDCLLTAPLFLWYLWHVHPPYTAAQLNSSSILHTQNPSFFLTSFVPSRVADLHGYLTTY